MLTHHNRQRRHHCLDRCHYGQTPLHPDGLRQWPHAVRADEANSSGHRHRANRRHPLYGFASSEARAFYPLDPTAPASTGEPAF